MRNVYLSIAIILFVLAIGTGNLVLISVTLVSLGYQVYRISVEEPDRNT